jgi:hypothetical protein
MPQPPTHMCVRLRGVCACVLTLVSACVRALRVWVWDVGVGVWVSAGLGAVGASMGPEPEGPRHLRLGSKQGPNKTGVCRGVRPCYSTRLPVSNSV